MSNKSLATMAMTCAALTISVNAQAADCGATIGVPPTSEFSKMFNTWTTGVINIADEIASTVPGYKATKEIVDDMKNFSAAVKTGSAFNDLRNKLSEQETAYRGVAQSVVDADKESTFNRAVATYFEKYRGVDKSFDEWSTRMDTLNSKISEVVTIEKMAANLGPGTLMAHLLIASEKIRLLKAKQYRVMHGLDSHDVFNTLVQELEYSKKELNNKFLVLKQRTSSSTTIKVESYSSGDGPRSWSAGVRYNGLARDEELKASFNSADAARVAAEALKTCRVNEIVSKAKENSKIAKTDNDYYAQVFQLKKVQRSSTIGRWGFFGQGIDYIVGSQPEGVDSLVLDFKQAPGANCQIIQKVIVAKIATSSCATANTSSLFAQSLRPNQNIGSPARKITSLGIEPLSVQKGISDIFVYGANFARGAVVRGVRNGQPAPDAILNAARATDGQKYDIPANVVADGLVSHQTGVGSSLDLGGIRHVGFIRITGLHGAVDGKRELTIKYIGRDGSVFSSQTVAYQFPFGKYANVIITAPNSASGTAGQPNVMNIEITSGSDFKYAEIEAFRPVDSPL
jgi:hypothetical protein